MVLIVEESPSCLLTPETRLKMQQQAIALCQATNYRSAGTVEMLAVYTLFLTLSDDKLNI